MDCVFCKIASGHLKSDVVFENQNFIVIKDINPKTEGHSLVIPKKHYPDFLSLPANLYEDLLKTTKYSAEKLMRDVNAEGFNLMINNGKSAGQIVEHLHLHILPRKGAGRVDLRV